MKKVIYLLLAAVILLAACNTTEPNYEEDLIDTGPAVIAPLSPPFSRGVNFSAWFETNSAHAIPFTKYTEQDFANVKSLGADVVRLPVKMHSMTSGAPDYTLDPLLFKFLDMAIDWAEKYELYIIIDNHSFDPVVATSVNIDQILIPVWAQVANRYKDRSDFVIYEILNEPHGITDARWGEIQGKAIEEIRKYDKDRWIIVGGTDYNSIGKLSAIPRYTDTKLIYTFHFYDPYLFTHQGASWGGPPLLTPLAGVPFPYESRRMPRIPAELRGTWIENSLNNNYMNEARLSTLSSTLDRAARFSRERNVPVFCGEFGVYMINSGQDDRMRWYSYVTSALNKRNISWTSWDYYGGFGLFNGERGHFNHDLNVGVVKALGFTPPVQIPRTEEPINDGFIIFDDYPNHQYVTVECWGDHVDFSLYESNMSNGEFAIRWGNARQYNAVLFRFERSKSDFSVLADEGFYLEFKARTNHPMRFDVRFVNTDSLSSIPWRMRYPINETMVIPNGNWHTIRIPLQSMSEHGAWINASQQWLTPRGEFSWKNVQLLEFVSEYEDMTGQVIWFDDIKITR